MSILIVLITLVLASVHVHFDLKAEREPRGSYFNNKFYKISKITGAIAVLLLAVLLYMNPTVLSD